LYYDVNILQISSIYECDENYIKDREMLPLLVTIVTIFNVNALVQWIGVISK